MTYFEGNSVLKPVRAICGEEHHFSNLMSSDALGSMSFSQAPQKKKGFLHWDEAQLRSIYLRFAPDRKKS